jgi:hypothetical protein
MENYMPNNNNQTHPIIHFPEAYVDGKRFSENSSKTNNALLKVEVYVLKYNQPSNNNTIS